MKARPKAIERFRPPLRHRAGVERCMHWIVFNTRKIWLSGKGAVMGRSFVARMLLTMTVVTVFLLCALTMIVSGNISGILLENEMDISDVILGDVDDCFAEQNDLIRSIVNQAYLEMLQLSAIGQPSAYQFLSESTSATSDEYILSKRVFDSFFKSLFMKDRAILSVTVHKRNNGCFYYLSRTSSAIIDRSDYAGHRYIHGAEEINYAELTGKLYPAYAPLNYAARNRQAALPSYILSMPLIRLPNTSIGTLILEFDASALSERLSRYANSMKGHVLVYTRSGEQVYSSAPEAIPGLDIAAVKDRWTRARINGEHYYLRRTLNADLDAPIIGVIPEERLYADIHEIERVCIIACACAIAACLLMMALISRRSTRRLALITDTIREIREGNFHIRIPPGKSQDELTEISDSVNQLSANLEHSIEQVFTVQLRQKDLELSQRSAELRALESQINPHFLHNTLEAIRMKAIIDGSPESAEMIRLLAEFLNRQIRGGSRITIKDELKHCCLYLRLFKIRHRDNLDYALDVDEQIQHYGTAKNIFQPIIENYVLHGFDPEREDNRIEIAGRLVTPSPGAPGMIRFTITDNGTGIPKERLDRITAQLDSVDEDAFGEDGIGLNNVNRRLHLAFGRPYGCRIASVYGRGTTVTITLPIINTEELTAYVHRDTRG